VEYKGSTYSDFFPSNRTLRRHIPSTNLQGKHHETSMEKTFTKRMKQEVMPIEDFYQGHVDLESSTSKRKVDLLIEDFYGEQDADKKLSRKKGKKCRNNTSNSTVHGIKDTRGRAQWT
jgi:hypothetical protein